jgi:uncharacterized protein (DUF983 family)
VTRAPQSVWRRHCPDCDEGVIGMNLWETARRRLRRCPACGKRIEFVVPALPYYLHATLQLVFWSAAPVLMLYLAFTGQWQWGMAAVLVSFLVMALVNLLFNGMLVARAEGDVPAEDVDYQRRFPGQMDR